MSLKSYYKQTKASIYSLLHNHIPWCFITIFLNDVPVQKMIYFPCCLGPHSLRRWQPVHSALRWVVRRDAHAGGGAHLHGLRRPHHLRVPARLPPSLEDRKVLRGQGEGGAKGERSHRGNVVIHGKRGKTNAGMRIKKNNQSGKAFADRIWFGAINHCTCNHPRSGVFF